MDEHSIKYIPWIKEYYLERLPNYDDALYKVKHLQATEAVLEFNSSFNLHIFLYQVMGAWIGRAMSWDDLTVTKRRGGKYIVNLRVLKNPNHNKLHVKL